MPETHELPLFPLNTVIFPGQYLPLHIFEPRYQMMIKESINTKTTFGIVLIRQGNEVGGGAVPYDIGTTARIRRVERQEEGRINILTLGEARFRIVDLEHERPFLTANVEMFPWQPSPAEEVEPRRDQLRPLLERYLLALSIAINNPVDLANLPSDPALMTSIAAIALRVSNREKQDLLSTNTVVELMDGCLRLMRREIRAFRIAVAIPENYEGSPAKYSLN